jgi:hypothetical protein
MVVIRLTAQLTLVTDEISITLGSTAWPLAGNVLTLDSGVFPVQILRFAFPVLVSFALRPTTMLCPFFAEMLDSFLPIRWGAAPEVVFWIRLRGGGWGGVLLILGIFDHESPPCVLVYEQTVAAPDPWPNELFELYLTIHDQV